MLRRILDEWFMRHELVPTIIGEFQDSATLKAFGQQGHGIFPGSTAMEKEICRQYQVQVVRRVDSVKQKFYAITVERRLKHPVVVALFDTARKEVLG
jgi:LysR family transcriptional activator of nhaA